jgi:uncharacterized membrane protein/uncharacterized protein YegL
MSFTTPLALLLFLLLPLVLYIGWPRQRFRRVRDSVSLVLRVALLSCIILGLSGLSLVRAADRLAVVFLLDASDSMGAQAQEDAVQFIRDSLPAMLPDDEAAVVLFGANALVERPLSAVRELANVSSTPITSNTDLAEAIRLGLALFPDDAAKRLVILSDGRATVGDTLEMGQMALVNNVEISYVPFTREETAEIQLTSVRVPETINEGQQFDLNVTIDADRAGPSTITVLGGGQVIHRERLNLRQGTNNYTLTLQSGGTGFRDFAVTVTPDEGSDSFYQNNAMATFSRVIGPPRVLVVAGNPDEARYIVQALQQSGLVVDQTTPSSLPIGLGALAQYETVILTNVPATQLSNRRMQVLESYVRDLGGGLVVVGGPQAYGPGGYFQTPLEDVLPVEMQIKDQQRLPQLTIAYVIDRSGSMSMVGPSGVENIELAKEAIIRSIDFLQPQDRAAVISFDAAASYIAQFQNVNDRVALQRLVGTLRSSGGTDILAGMNLTARDIVNEPSQYKHIILLTDGGADPTGLVQLSDRLYTQYGVTTSSIAFGGGAPPFLADMATAGGGNYHDVIAIEDIPLIFAQETVLATRSYIVEAEFFPNYTARSPILEGINSTPALLGYVATTAKPTATVILRTPDTNNDPILATWQYGLGRSVAFTSDGTARWGQGWVSWQSFARFWSQAVRWTITEGADANLETRVVMENEQARIIVDARTLDGEFLNGLSLQASVVGASAESEGQSVRLQQIAPGRYEATFTPSAEGAYFMRVTGDGIINEQTATVGQTAGWVMNYSPEYDVNTNREDGTLLLQDLARLTNGRALTETPALSFAHTLAAADASLPVWPWLFLAAMLLLPLDIAVRRLVVTRSDLQRLREWAFPAGQALQQRAERLNTLMGAKARAQQKTDDAAANVRTNINAPTTAATPNPVGTIGALKRAVKTDDVPATAAPQAQPQPVSRMDALKRAKDNVHPLNATPAPSAKAASQPTDAPKKPAEAPKPVMPPKSEDGNVAGRLLRRRKRDDGSDDA